MNPRLPALLAAALIPAGAAPAPAGSTQVYFAAGAVIIDQWLPVPTVASSNGDFREYQVGGRTCGFLSSNDPTALVDQNPDHQISLVTCGPIATVNASGSVDSTTIEACFEVNNPSGFGTGTCVRSTAPGPATALASVITYTATATDDVYLCTTISGTGSKGAYSFNFDDDREATNGEQCTLATSAGA